MSLLTEGMVIAHAQRLIGRMVGRGLVPKAMPADDYTALWGAMTEEFSAIEAATAAKYAERIAELERLHKQACDMYMMKNRSGCVCKIDPDTDELLSPCGLHDEWLSEKTADLQAKLDAAAVDAEPPGWRVFLKDLLAACEAGDINQDCEHPDWKHIYMQAWAMYAAAPDEPPEPDDIEDAKRYRWLKDFHIGDDPETINLPRAKQSGLDAAIDAMRTGEPKP